MRALILTAAAVFPVAFTGMTALAAELGWTAAAVAFGALAAAGWALLGLLAALTRPGWTAEEKAALRGGMDMEGLLDAIPRQGDHR